MGGLVSVLRKNQAVLESIADYEGKLHKDHKARRIVLLVDLREFYFRFRVEGTKKNK